MKSFWDRVSFIYDFNENFFNGEVYENMIYEACSHICTDDKVLEIAAGTGAISIEMAQIAREVICTDLSTDMLKKAFIKSKRNGLGNIKFKTCDCYELPLRSESFDAVVMANVLHLLDEPQKAVNEAIRVLKPGGKLLLPTFFCDTKPSSKLLVGFYGLIGFKPARSFTEESYLEFLNSCGLRNISFKLIDGNIPLGFAYARKGHDNG